MVQLHLDAVHRHVALRREERRVGLALLHDHVDLDGDALEEQLGGGFASAPVQHGRTQAQAAVQGQLFVDE